MEKVAASVGLPWVSLLGNRLAPGNLIGAPQITGSDHFTVTR